MTAAGAPLLEVERLRVELRAEQGARTLVSDVSLAVRPGEAVAIVGESGSGKSMTARAIAGLLPRGVHAAGGGVRFDSQELLGGGGRQLRRVRGSGLTLLPQDPFTMLNPLRRCGDQVLDGLRAGRALSRPEAQRELVRRLAEVGIDDPSVARRYPFQLSGGLRQRVGMAAALARDPRLLIADEPSTALDVTTQKQVLDLLRSLQASRGMAIVLITHDLRVAFSTCTRIYVIYAGEVLESGEAVAVREQPRHPYTLGLLLSEAPVDRRLRELVALPGGVPAPDEVRDECPFAARCRWVQPACRAGHPALRAVPAPNGPPPATRLTRCIRAEEIQAEMNQAKAVGERAVAATSDESPAEAAILRIDGMRKTFQGVGRRAEAVVAVEDASIVVAAGECVGLVGESGSGKTTLSRCAIALETFDGGEVTVAGERLAARRRPTRAERRRLSRVAQIIFQDPYTSLNPTLTVQTALAEALEAGGERASATRVQELLAVVGLPAAYAQRKPAALSGGERQRVAIARALATQPRLLICDEPVSALDVSVQAHVLNLLNRLREELGLALLFVTHDLAVVRQVASRVYVMRQGRIVESGITESVLDTPQQPYTRTLIASIPA